MSKWVEMTLLVTVKAYPSISTKYGEAVCVAGIRLDTAKPGFVRLFPVAFRDLPDERQFNKFEVITLKAQEHSTDLRRESWRPDVDSIKRGDFIPAGGPWLARRDRVEPLIGPTMCELNRGRRGGGDGPSLGIVRPKLVRGIEVKAEGEWSHSQKSTMAQGSLLSSKRSLVKPNHSFSYSYICEEPECRGHTQKIVDWELGEAYRKWPQRGQELIDGIRRKWFDHMCAENREPLFFVGDPHQHPGAFMVLGTFYPERKPNEAQLELALS